MQGCGMQECRDAEELHFRMLHSCLAASLLAQLRCHHIGWPGMGLGGTGMSGGPAGGGMSGGGTGLMSGGGVSMMSGGRGTVGWGCSIMPHRLQTAHPAQDPHKRDRCATPAVSSPRFTRAARPPASARAHCCAPPPRRASGSRTACGRSRSGPRSARFSHERSCSAASVVSARSCVVTSPMAPASTSARTTASAPIFRSWELVPCRISSSRKRTGDWSARQLDDVADLEDLAVEARVPLLQRILDSNGRTDRQRRQHEAIRAHRRTSQRENGVCADRAKQRALARHVRAADDEHARRLPSERHVVANR